MTDSYAWRGDVNEFELEGSRSFRTAITKEEDINGKKSYLWINEKWQKAELFDARAIHLKISNNNIFLSTQQAVYKTPLQSELHRVRAIQIILEIFWPARENRKIMLTMQYIHCDLYCNNLGVWYHLNPCAWWCLVTPSDTVYWISRGIRTL